MSSRIPWYSFRTAVLPFICLLALMLSLCMVPAHGAAIGRGDWLMIDHDLQHTGCSPFYGPPVASLQWSNSTFASVFTSPAIAADGTIYVGSGDALYAINPEDGSLRWSWISPLGGSISSPAIDAYGNIYVGSTDWNVYSINPFGGTNWAYKTNGAIVSSPAIAADGTLYIGSLDDNLYAIDSATGKEIRAFGTGGGISSSPAIGVDGTIYVGSADMYVYAFLASGSMEWKCKIGVPITASPALGNGMVYIGAPDGNVYGIGMGAGKVAMTFITKNAIVATPAIGLDGTVYVGSTDKTFYAFSPGGGLRWKYTTGNAITSSAALDAEGAVYFGSEDNNLYALNTADGSLKWQYTTMAGVDSSPAIGADGTIVVGSDDANVYAIGPGVPSPLTLKKSVSPVHAVPGGFVTYTLQYGNTGSSALANVVLSDALPANMTYMLNSATGNPNYNPATNTLTWSLNALPIGGAGQVTFRATVAATATAGSVIDNTASIFCAGVAFPVSSSAAFTVETSQRGDWWLFRHDPQHTGRSPFTGPNSPVEKWAFPTGSAIYSSPAIAVDGTVYVGSDDYYLYAINANGTEKWAFLTWNKILSSPALATDGTIYVGANYANLLYAINPDGTPQWMFSTDAPINASPTIGADGTIYVGSGDYLYAVDPLGTPNWAFLAGAEITSSPALGTDGTIYVGSGNQLYAVNADGSPKWVFTAGDLLQSSPAIGADGTIYVGSNDDNLYAINPDGSKKWVYTTGDQLVSSPALGTDGTIYVGSDDGNLYAINPDGTQKWTSLTGSAIQSSPALGADGTIYVGSDDTNLYAFNPDGSQLWTFPTGDQVQSSPVIGADGTVYIGSYDSNLYAINGIAANLTLTKSVLPAAAMVGGIESYTLVFGDTGSMATTNVVLTDTLPANMTYVKNSASSNASYDPVSGTLTWVFSTLPAGGSAQVTFQATIAPSAPLGGTISNTASITSSEVTTPVSSNAAIVTVVAAGRDNWWMFGHNPQHSNLSTFIGPTWSWLKWTDVISHTSAPAIDLNGTIYVGSLDNNLYALSPTDGSLKWKYTTGDQIYSSPAIGVDGTIFIGSNDANLYAINPDGTQKWAYLTGNMIWSSPALATDGTVYFGSKDGVFYALNPANGVLKWKYQTGNSIFSSPAISAIDGTIYVGSDDMKLYAFTPQGTLKWFYPTQGLIDSAPTVGADGTIYFCSDDHNFYALNPDGSLKWKYPTEDLLFSSAPLIGNDGTIYVAIENGSLYAFNPDGTVQWEYSIASGFDVAPVMDANGTIYIGSSDGILHALNSTTGTQQWRYVTESGFVTASVLSADGTLYCGSGSVLYAINTRWPSLTLLKSVTPSNAAPRDVVTYTLTYGDAGSTATNVVLSDTLPSNVTYVPNSASGNATYDPATATLSWSLDPLADGDSGSETFQATVVPMTTIGSLISNMGNITCAETPSPVFSNPAAFTVVAAKRGDWWMFHHDPQHTGRSPFLGPESPAQKWAFVTGEGIGALPVIGIDGTVYIGSDDNNFYAINQDGSLKWKLPNKVTASTAALGSDGTIYAGSADNHLYAINPDGTQKWAFATGNWIWALSGYRRGRHHLRRVGG